MRKKKKKNIKGCNNTKIYREESESIIAQIEIYNTEEMELIRIIHFDHLNKQSVVFMDSLKIVIPHSNNFFSSYILNGHINRLYCGITLTALIISFHL